MVCVWPAVHFKQGTIICAVSQCHPSFILTVNLNCDTQQSNWISEEYAFSMDTRTSQKTTGLDSGEVERPGRQLRPRACARCHLRFSTPQELENHGCPVVMTSPDTSRQRRRTRSPLANPPPEESSSPRRGRARGDEAVLTRAMHRAYQEAGPSTSRAPRSHRCSQCEKSFTSPGKLEQHMYSHTGERPFACSECTKAFSSKFKLMRHVLIHSADRKHKCQFCERSFHRKDHLKNHAKVHNPDKKIYRCEKEACRKEYNSYLSFRKHMAVHAAEEGGLDCKICGRSFASREEILYHLKVHAGSRTVKNPSEKKFQCDHCDRKFFTRKDVKRHLVVHTGKRDFLCQFCPQRFGRKDHLVRHIKKSHGVKTVRPKREVFPSSAMSPQATSSHAPSVLPGPSGLQRRTTRRTAVPRQAPSELEAVRSSEGQAITSEPGTCSMPTPLYSGEPPPYPAYKMYPEPSQEEGSIYSRLGIKIEEEDEAVAGPSSGVDLNQLFHLTGNSSHEDIDPLSLIELSAEEEQLMQLMTQPSSTAEVQPSLPAAPGLLPQGSMPLPGFSQIFQQQPPPPPPQDQ